MTIDPSEEFYFNSPLYDASHDRDMAVECAAILRGKSILASLMSDGSWRSDDENLASLLSSQFPPRMVSGPVHGMISAQATIAARHLGGRVQFTKAYLAANKGSSRVVY